MSATTIRASHNAKPLMQAILEGVTGRNLDPVEVTFGSRTRPVGRGYHQTIHIRTETNLRTGHAVTTETEGAIV